MTKKKSILAFALAFLLIVPQMLLLTACGHDHTYSNEWSTSETAHWHACTDKDCKEIKDLAEHEFVWTIKTEAGVHKDIVETGTCSTCGYQEERTVVGTMTHSYADTYSKDATGHWHESTCEHETPLKGDFAEHNYGEWIEKSPADYGVDKVEKRTCLVCNYEEKRTVANSALVLLIDCTGTEYSNVTTLKNNETISGARMEGKILGEDGNALASSLRPADIITIQNPTITGGTSATGQKTVDFYVRAKVTYRVVLYSNAEGASEGDLDTEAGEISLETFGLIEAGLVVETGLKFNTAWVAGVDGWNYLGTAVSTAGLTKVNADATEPFKLFEGDTTSTMRLGDWASAQCVEAGGPRVTYQTEEREVAQIIGILVIEVIQAQNMTDTALTTATWVAAA